MRISDWSSDVCSSDLFGVGEPQLDDHRVKHPLSHRVADLVDENEQQAQHRAMAREKFAERVDHRLAQPRTETLPRGARAAGIEASGTGLERAEQRGPDSQSGKEIGRASCRERGWLYVWIAVAEGTLKKNTNTKQ